MTECERLIKEGFLPREFFKEEVICDYLVTEKQKKIWAIQLDLLVRFSEVCNKHGLRWFVFLGTLLGSIRHQGFIPWDDDIDIVMPRDDYEKLMTLQDEFDDRYFLQNHLTDPGFAYTVGRLCNLNTTFIDRKFRNGKWRMGICIDIAVLEPWDSNVKADDPRVQRIRKICRDLATVMRKDTPDLSPEDKKRVEELECDDIIKMHEELRILEKSCMGERPDSWQIITQPSANAWENNYSNEEIFPLQKRMFNGYEVNVPNDFLSMLWKNYKGSLGYIDKEHRGMWHGNFGFDPDKSYKDLTNEEREHLWDEKEEDAIKNKRVNRSFDGSEIKPGHDQEKPLFGTEEYSSYLLSCKKKTDIPESWDKIIRREDGSYKKVMLYCTTAGKLLGEKRMLDKMRENFELFRENSDKIALIWRPEPGVAEIVAMLNADLAVKYNEIVTWFKENHIGIYDDSADVDRAVAIADAFYGDESTVTSMCVEKGIPAMIQSADVL